MWPEQSDNTFEYAVHSLSEYFFFRSAHCYNDACIVSLSWRWAPCQASGTVLPLTICVTKLETYELIQYLKHFQSVKII